MNLVLVRHGQSTNNAHNQPRVSDPALTALGEQQASLVAEALQQANLMACCLYVSPMRRALQTAAPIRQRLGLTAHVIPDICESGGMETETGMGRDLILQDYPDVVLDERITARGWWTPAEMQENEEQVYCRAERALNVLAQRHGGADDTLIVVTHGTFGSALVSVALGLEPCGYTRFPFANCALTHLGLEHRGGEESETDPLHTRLQAAQRTRLRFHNRTAHLPADLLT